MDVLAPEAFTEQWDYLCTLRDCRTDVALSRIHCNSTVLHCLLLSERYLDDEGNGKGRAEKERGVGGKAEKKNILGCPPLKKNSGK